MIKYILATLVLFLPSMGMACSCMFEDLPLEESVGKSFSGASSVVLATAIHIEESGTRVPSEEPLAPGAGLGGDITQFNEIQSWKGQHGKSFHTKINTMCCMCGYSFEKGKSYLLYLYGPNQEGFYSTSTCSRTKPAEVAEEEIAILNRIAPENTMQPNVDASAD